MVRSKIGTLVIVWMLFFPILFISSHSNADFKENTLFELIDKFAPKDFEFSGIHLAFDGNFYQLIFIVNLKEGGELYIRSDVATIDDAKDPLKLYPKYDMRIYSLIEKSNNNYLTTKILKQTMAIALDDIDCWITKLDQIQEGQLEVSSDSEYVTVVQRDLDTAPPGLALVGGDTICQIDPKNNSLHVVPTG